MTLLLGLDIGTTSIKAVLYDPSVGRVLQIASRPTPVSHPKTGWSEHDPQALWEAAAACIREAAAGRYITAVAISSMAEAGIFLDKSGQPVAPMIAWYDRRSEPQAAWIEQKIKIEDLYKITGQRVSPSFGATKMLWIRSELPEAFSRAVIWLPVSSYLLWRLSGKVLVDHTIAARTLLFDERTLSWSESLIDLLHLSPSLLPGTAPGGSPAGTVTQQVTSETGLSPSTVCVLGGHDHLCASLAAGAHKIGVFSDSTGSANALLMLTQNFLDEPSLALQGYASYAFVLEGLYTLKGGLKAAGSAVEWLARHFSAPESSPDYARLEAEASTGIGLRAGPLWLPHFIGSGTPQGDRFSRAAAVGIRIEHNRGDVFRGMLESLAFWTRHNLEEMQRLTGQQIDAITLTGGATRIRLLSQLKASVTGLPVRIPQIPEAAATGAALLAGLGSGTFATPLSAVSSLKYEQMVIEPDNRLTNWYQAIYTDAYLPLYDSLININRALEKFQDKAL